MQLGLGLGLGVGDGAARREAAWWHEEALLAADFEAGRWMRGRRAVSASALLTTTRSSSIHLPDRDDILQTLGINTLPRTDRGLYVNGQFTVLNRSSGDFRVSPPADTGWSRSQAASFEDKPSIFAGAVACELQGSGAGSEAFTTPRIAGLAGAYVFDVIIERGTNTLSSFGVSRELPSFAWVAFGQYNWETNSLTTIGGAIASSRIQDLGVGPNGGSLRRLSIQLDISDGTSWGGYIYAAGSGMNTHKAIAHYGALYSGVIHSDAVFLSPLGSSGTLFASDIIHVRGVRTSNGQPEPFPGWEAEGLDGAFGINASVKIDRLNAASARTIAAVGIDANQLYHLYLDTDNRIKARLRKLGPELRGNGAIGLTGTATAATYNGGTGVGTVSRAESLGNQSFVEWTGLTDASIYLVDIENTGTTGVSVRSGGPGGVPNIVAGGQRQVVSINPAFGTLTVAAQSNSTTASFTVHSFREIIDHYTLQSGVISTPGNYDIAAILNPGANSLTVSGGVAGDTNASVETLPAGSTTLRVGSDFGVLNPFNGWIKEMQILKVAT